MNSSRLLCAFVLVGSGACTFARQPVSAEWKARYDKLSVALSKRDASAYMSYMDKSYQFFNPPAGKEKPKPVKFSDYKHGLEDFLKHLSKLKATCTGSNMRTKGKDILIDFRYEFDGSANGTNGKPIPFAIVATGTHTWRKFGNIYKVTKEDVKKQVPLKK